VFATIQDKVRSELWRLDVDAYIPYTYLPEGRHVTRTACHDL